jgi:hypothetical protein
LANEDWPALDWAGWKDTCSTLHLWTQVVGKIRVKLTPWVNHGWHSALYVTARGLTTSPIPYEGRHFQVDFDFIAHQLSIRDDAGGIEVLALSPMSVADFHGRVMGALARLGIMIRIHRRPNEVADAIPFDEDQMHASYDAGAAHRFWRVLSSSTRVFQQFRTGFLGKVSPVHFFWGSFDLAVTRFSGRPAPLHPGGVPNLPDSVAREAYSHEVSSAGFWPGDERTGFAAFYAYAWPEPKGFRHAPVGPAEAGFDASLGEFLLPYDAVRVAPDPESVLLEFLETSYAAAADAGGWDRAALECAPGRPGVPRPLD